MKQRSEEEHVTVLLQVLSSYINPSGEDDEEDVINNVLPPTFPHLLATSSLLSALSSYLRNDSGKYFYNSLQELLSKLAKTASSGCGRDSSIQLLLELFTSVHRFKKYFK